MARSGTPPRSPRRLDHARGAAGPVERATGDAADRRTADGAGRGIGGLAARRGPMLPSANANTNRYFFISSSFARKDVLGESVASGVPNEGKRLRRVSREDRVCRSESPRTLREFARPSPRDAATCDDAVDFRRVGSAAPDRALPSTSSTSTGQRRGRPCAAPLAADLGLHCHEARAALLASPPPAPGRGGRWPSRRRRVNRRSSRRDRAALPRGRPAAPRIGLGLAREAGDEGAAHREVGTDLAPRVDALEVLLGDAGRFIA